MEHHNTKGHRHEVRLSDDLHAIFQAQLADHNLKTQELLEEWIAEWTSAPDFHPRAPSDRAKLDIRKLIASRFAEAFLKSDLAWVDDAVVDAVTKLGTGSIFGHRHDHYIEEKTFLAKVFSGWLLDQIVRLLDEGRDVCLIADSGTSVYFVIQEFAQLLRDRCADVPNLKRLHFLTNNFAALQCYTEISNLRKIPVHLAEEIKPHSTGGELQIEYAAFVGEDAISSLHSCRKRLGKDAHIVTILAANWVRVVGNQRYPSAMYRDPKQGDFKKALLEISDSVYLPVPLGKVFVNQGEANVRFRPQASSEPRVYHDVELVGEKSPERINLITTSRSPGRLLHQHARDLLDTIYHARIPCDQAMPRSGAPVRWAVLPFPEADSWPPEDELIKEFPHEYSRRPEVRRMFGMR